VVEDFPDSNDVFPGTQIKGGVCFFLWNRDHSGPALVRNHLTGGIVSEATRPLLEPGADIFVRYNQAVTILKKVVESTNTSSMKRLEIQEDKAFINLVSTAKPFGFRTFFKAPNANGPGAIKIYQNGGFGYVQRSSVEKNQQLIDSWKVFIPRAGSGSDAFPHPILGTPFLGEPGSVSTETYNCIGPFATQTEAENAIRYISTRVFRFLVLLHKSSQDANRNVYTFVPKLDFSKTWNDSDLRKLFSLSESEWSFIQSMIRPMELPND